MKVGLLTGGGDCPGLNAVIHAVTRGLIRRCNAEVLGINGGFAGLMEKSTQPLTWHGVEGLVGLGGTILGTTNRLDPCGLKPPHSKPWPMRPTCAWTPWSPLGGMAP